MNLLVNSAGFGLPLAFERNDIEDEARHLRLHVEVPMRLMHAALPGMLERRSGTILNIASVSAVMPRSTYGAVKNWQVQFSRWASGAYRPRGVTVTAVCPGYTHTDFHARLGLPRGEEGIPDWLWLEAPRVVEESLRDAGHGKAVSVPLHRDLDRRPSRPLGAHGTARRAGAVSEAAPGECPSDAAPKRGAPSRCRHPSPRENGEASPECLLMGRRGASGCTPPLMRA